MSKQQIQQATNQQDASPKEDPLAELARIVAGEKVELRNPPELTAPVLQTVAPTPVDIAPETPTREYPQIANVEVPQIANISVIESSNSTAQKTQGPENDLDLESQLLAELGAGDSPIEPPIEPLSPSPITQNEIARSNPVHAMPKPVVAEPVYQPAQAPIANESLQVAPQEPIVDFETALEQQLEQQLVQQEAATTVQNETPAVIATASELENVSDLQISTASNPNMLPDENPHAAKQTFDDFDLDAVFERELPVSNEAVAETAVETIPNVPQHVVEPQIESERAPKSIFAGSQEAPVEEPIVPAPQFQFQAAPDFQQADQKIEKSVREFQSEVVENVDIEDAFSDAFADELSLEMEQNEVAPTAASVQVENLTPGIPQSEISFEQLIAAQPESNNAPAPAFVDPTPKAQEKPIVAASPPRQKGGIRMAAMALGLAILAGGGAVAYSYMNGPTEIGDPVLVKADTSDFKIKPEEPGGKTIANQDQPVYDAVAGTKPIGNSQDTLIATNEEPVDIARSITIDKPVKSDNRLASAENAAQGDSGLAVMQPRKVKTVSVRADGTIVPSISDPVANLPSSLQTALVAASPETPIANDTTIDGANSTGKIAIPSVNPNLPQAATPQPEIIVPTAVKTRSLAVPKVEPVVAKPAPVETSAVSTQPVGEGYAVQISSQRSFESAEATYQNLKRRFASLLGDQAKEIREAKVDGKGTFYRVRILQNTKSAALDFCTRYKSAGGSCFVTK